MIRTQAQRSPAAPLPRNLSHFGKDAYGRLLVGKLTQAGFSSIEWLQCIIPGSLYAMRAGIVDDDRRARVETVQLFPRLLCTCEYTLRSNEVCGHMLAALTAERSPLIRKSGRRDVVVRSLARAFPTEVEVHARLEVMRTERELWATDPVKYREYADRVMIDPDAPDAHLKLAFINRPDRSNNVRVGSQIPELIADRDVLPVLLADIMWDAGRNRLAMYAPEHLVSEVFSAVVQRDAIHAFDILKHARWKQHRLHLGPADLLPFLRSEDMEHRDHAKKVLAEIGRLQATQARSAASVPVQ